MTDKELLEAAAKAAGWKYRPPGHIDVKLPGLDGWIDPATGGVHWRDLWHPLTDDGDAMRLSVALSIDYKVRSGATWVCWPEGERGAYLHQEPHGNDPCAATRRAIVRAAAAMAVADPVEQGVGPHAAADRNKYPDGYYLLGCPRDPAWCLVYLYDCDDFNGVRHLSWGQHDGGGLMPITDLIADSVLIPAGVRAEKRAMTLMELGGQGVGRPNAEG